MTETIAPKQYLSTRDLATRWGVTLATARNTTRHSVFPPVTVLGPQTLRWEAAAVDAFDAAGGVRRPPRVVTGSRPQHLVNNPRVQPVKRTTITVVRRLAE